jgi:CMP-N,N'-diacetyllegionaminic acid synthase
MSVVALIPARAGSKRVADKNVRPLAGHPVLAYAIAAARDSGVFASVIVSTDSERYAGIAKHYGAEVPFLRPAAIAGDKSPDIEWVEHALTALSRAGRTFEHFSILRPTNPFRSAATIRRAWDQLAADPSADSLRAVELCQQHPGKMWIVRGNRMSPLLSQDPGERPWHSRQYADLPEIYVQNASLEIAKASVVLEGGTIAGQVIAPFLTRDHEGLDINHPWDWDRAEGLLASGAVTLPAIGVAPYKDES